MIEGLPYEAASDGDEPVRWGHNGYNTNANSHNIIFNGKCY